MPALNAPRIDGRTPPAQRLDHAQRRLALVTRVRRDQQQVEVAVGIGSLTGVAAGLLRARRFAPALRVAPRAPCRGASCARRGPAGGVDLWSPPTFLRASRLRGAARSGGRGSAAREDKKARRSSLRDHPLPSGCAFSLRIDGREKADMAPWPPRPPHAPPGGVVQIGKIRNGPFLILPICDMPPGRRSRRGRRSRGSRRAHHSWLTGA